MKLFNWQKNELFQALIAAGLHLNDFVEYAANDGWYYIKLKSNTDICFSIRLTNNKEEGNFFISKMPGKSSAPNKHESLTANSWNDSGYSSCTYYFEDWAKDVKKEVYVSDLWLESTKALQLFASTDVPAADSFTIAELGAVQGQLRMLGQLFEKSELLCDYRSELATLIQDAAVKAETFTKKDWQNWVKGAFISTITSLELSEVQTKELLALVRLAFGGLFLQA